MMRLIALAADAPSVLHDALTNGNVWLAIVAGLAVLVPVVLHALGKDIPLLSPVIDALLEVAVKMLPGKAPPAPPLNPDGSKPVEGVAKVVDIQKLDK